jgi:transcriptional regulator with XRE-family HTH domain
MTETEMASRVLVSRPTIRKLENGDLSVGLTVLVGVLEVLGMDADLDLIGAEDDLGRRLADARLPRPRRSATPDLADEL